MDTKTIAQEKLIEDQIPDDVMDMLREMCFNEFASWLNENAPEEVIEAFTTIQWAEMYLSNFDKLFTDLQKAGPEILVKLATATGKLRSLNEIQNQLR